MTSVEGLARRFDDLVAALERIALALEELEALAKRKEKKG